MPCRWRGGSALICLMTQQRSKVGWGPLRYYFVLANHAARCLQDNSGKHVSAFDMYHNKQHLTQKGHHLTHTHTRGAPRIQIWNTWDKKSIFIHTKASCVVFLPANVESHLGTCANARFLIKLCIFPNKFVCNLYVLTIIPPYRNYKYLHMYFTLP